MCRFMLAVGVLGSNLWSALVLIPSHNVDHIPKESHSIKTVGEMGRNIIYLMLL